MADPFSHTVTIFATFCWWLLIVTETGNGHVRRTRRHGLSYATHTPSHFLRVRQRRAPTHEFRGGTIYLTTAVVTGRYEHTE